MLKRSCPLFILILLAGAFSGVSGQVWTPLPLPRVDIQNQIWRTFRMGQIGNQMAADMARSRKSGTTRPPAKTAANRAIYPKQFSFQRSANSPLAAKMAASSGASRAETARMQKLIDDSWSKYQFSFADENKRLGMPFNDVASAMTYYIVLSHIYARDLPSLPSENSVAVYKQVSEILSKDAEFGKLQPSDKQMLAELLVTMGGMPALLYEQNRNNNEKLAAGKANLERMFGTAAAKVSITANGVEF